MRITLTRRVLDEMTDDDLAAIGRTVSNAQGVERIPVNLLKMDEADTGRLRATFERLRSEGVRGVGAHINDIDLWREVLEKGNSGEKRPRTLRHFADLLVEYIRNSGGQRVYWTGDQQEGDRLAYYVNTVEYHPERRNSDRYQPAAVSMHLLYWLLGREHSNILWFHKSDVDGCTVGEALAGQGMLAETEQLRADYLDTNRRFNEIHQRIGTQFLAGGHAMSIDTRNRREIFPMSYDDEPGKVVVDIVHEAGEHQEENTRSRIRTDFWLANTPHAPHEEDSDALDVNVAVLDEEAEVEDRSPEIPVHPFVPVYHLSRHRRYRINVGLLEEYRYQTDLGAQLVLPALQKQLLDVLVSQGRIEFQDIVEGKGSGACILLSGPPGVGKTLSAEVFAEATRRPLLSVQADQLGVSPEGIEQRLQEVLRRASRWNAVLLLDEADVYINARNLNIQHNAMVAAFLRVMEHHTATIFMTCNFLEQVDDAVASRCLARIKFEKPDVSDQRRIWGIMNELNHTGLSDDDLDAIVSEHDDLTGRDIKQLLKLGSLWAESQQEPVSPQAIGFVKAFRPNQ